MEKNRSHDWLAARARSRAAGGRVSPNQTTSGRKCPPQPGQRGGVTSLSSHVSTRTFSSKHLVREMFPCNSIALRPPARWCKPSTFCVIRLSCGTRRSSSTSATCPGLGCARETNSRRQAYHSHTSFGLRWNASGVARSSGLNFDQSPLCESRKVGTPLSAEIPEPVSAATCRVLRNAFNSFAGKSSAVKLIHGADQRHQDLPVTLRRINLPPAPIRAKFFADTAKPARNACVLCRHVEALSCAVMFG